MSNIAVFCGAREQVDSIYIDTAYTLGKLIAEKCHTLVYGG
jgi:predicted Rossmann-fold nucleotide-binding protein